MSNPNIDESSMARTGSTGSSSGPSGFNAGPFPGAPPFPWMNVTQVQPRPINQQFTPGFNDAVGGNPVNFYFGGHEHVDIHVYTGNSYMMHPEAATATGILPPAFQSTAGTVTTAVQTSSLLANPSPAAPPTSGEGGNQWSFIGEQIGEQNNERNAAQNLTLVQNHASSPKTAEETTPWLSALPESHPAVSSPFDNDKRGRGRPRKYSVSVRPASSSQS